MGKRVSLFFSLTLLVLILCLISTICSSTVHPEEHIIAEGYRLIPFGSKRKDKHCCSILLSSNEEDQKQEKSKRKKYENREVERDLSVLLNNTDIEEDIDIGCNIIMDEETKNCFYDPIRALVVLEKLMHCGEKKKNTNENKIEYEDPDPDPDFEYELERTPEGCNNLENENNEEKNEKPEGLNVVYDYKSEHSYSLKKHPILDALEMICKEYKLKKEAIDNILYKCSIFLRNKYKNEKYKLTERRDKNRCPLREYCIYVLQKKRNDEPSFGCSSSRSLEILNSYDAIRLYACLLFLCSQNRLLRIRVETFSKIQKKMAELEEFYLHQQQFMTPDSKFSFFHEKFVIPGMGIRIRKKTYILMQALGVSGNNGVYTISKFEEADKFINNHIEKTFVEFKKMYILFSDLIRMEKREFNKNLLDQIGEDYINHLIVFSNYLEDEQKKCLDFISQQCKNEKNVIYLLYYKFGHIIMQRLMVENYIDDCIFILDCFSEFSNYLEPMINAMLLLELSEGRKKKDRDIVDTTNSAMHNIMYHCQLKLFHILILYILEESKKGWIPLKNYLKSNTVKLSNDEISNIASFFCTARKFIQLGSRLISLLVKSRNHLIYVLTVYDMIDKINKNIFDLKKMCQNFSSAVHLTKEELFNQKDNLLKEIVDMYFILSKMVVKDKLNVLQESP